MEAWVLCSAMRITCPGGIQQKIFFFQTTRRIGYLREVDFLLVCRFPAASRKPSSLKYHHRFRFHSGGYSFLESVLPPCPKSNPLGDTRCIRRYLQITYQFVGCRLHPPASSRFSAGSGTRQAFGATIILLRMPRRWLQTAYPDTCHGLRQEFKKQTEGISFDGIIEETDDNHALAILPTKGGNVMVGCEAVTHPGRKAKLARNASRHFAYGMLVE